MTNHKNFSTKRIMEIPGRQKDKILEQSVAISTLGSVKNNIILRPKFHLLPEVNLLFNRLKEFLELWIKVRCPKLLMVIQWIS
jgi:hypothetical protein